MNSGNETQGSGFLSDLSHDIIVGVVAALILFVLGWFRKPLWNAAKGLRRMVTRQAPPLPQGGSLPFKYATSFAELECRIGELVPDLHGDLSIAYQPRLPQGQQQRLQEKIDHSQFLILVGRMGIGKTREGIEALRRLERRLGEPITVLFPTTPFTASISLPSDIPKNHIVLFMDNLHNPPYYTPSRQSESTAKAGDFPTWLRECLTHFKGHADFRVIATVRNDLRGRDYEETIRCLRSILKEFGFEEVALPSWNQNNVDILISALAVSGGITVPEDARRELARRCAAEGTPNYARLAVSRVEPGNMLTLQMVHTLPATFNDLWQKTWDERIAPYPQRICLFNALALLRETGVTPITSITLEFAVHLCGKPWWWNRRKVKAAIRSVSPWIGKKSATMECAEAYLPKDISMAKPGYTALLSHTLRGLLHTAPKSIVSELINFGNFLCEFPLGDRAKNLEEAIACYKRALEVYTREAFPKNWAMTQNNLGIAYWSMGDVRDKEANLEKAIDAHKDALKVYTLQAFPTDYAMTQNNLGIAYGVMGDVRDKEANLEKAVDAYKEALKVYTLGAFPTQYAGTQNNLGIAYGNMGDVRDQEANLEKAIDAYKEALKVYTLQAFPVQYAAIQNNLGAAYGDMGEVRDQEANLEKAIDAHKDALKVYTLQAFPVQYAAIQNNLGTAYGDMGEVRDKEANLEKAIDACKDALKVYTLQAFPVQYAVIQNNLGAAYWNMGDVRDKEANLEKAIDAYKEALKVRTFQAFPMDYAMTQNNLGVAYRNRISGDRTQNLEEAIACYKRALEVRTREAFPEKHEQTANNLKEAERDLEDYRKGQPVDDSPIADKWA